jgi:hypothetical protein
MDYDNWESAMSSQLPYFLSWLLHEYEIPSELSDARYGVRYTNPTYSTLLSAPTLSDQESEQRNILMVALFREGVKSDALEAGEVYDKVMAIDNPSRDRAKNYTCFRSSSALSALLRSWVGGVRGEWVNVGDFRMRYRELRSSRFVFDFQKAPYPKEF